MISTKCPSCGATNKFDEDNIPNFCSFCGAHLPKMNEFIKNSMELKAEQIHLQIENLKTEKELQQKKMETRSGLISDLAPVVLFIALFIFLYWIFNKIMSL